MSSSKSKPEVKSNEALVNEFSARLDALLATCDNMGVDHPMCQAMAHELIGFVAALVKS